MSVYRLAICEDEKIICSEMESVCHDILTEAGIEHTIEKFASACELERTLEKREDAFDLLLLDIQMEKMTGMELAKSLRERGNRVSVIFVSGCDEYLLEGYGVQPVHFLLKPIERGKLEEAILTDWKCNHRQKSIMLRFGTKVINLLLSEIYYIESYNHKIILHQREKEETYSFSLKDMEKQLPSTQFCRCHNSYLVNMACIEGIGRTEILLKGGIHLPIGRTYYKNLQSTFIRYLNQ